MPDIITELAGLTDRLIAYRILRRMEVGRLEEKLARVAGIAQRVTEHVETRADRVLEREPQLLQRSEQVFAAKNALLDDAEKALDRVERAMGLISNDPLQSSGSSPEGQPAPSPLPGVPYIEPRQG